MIDNDNPHLHGATHDAAWAIVRPRPLEGWRNSYQFDIEPEMATAHTAAHDAFDDYPDYGVDDCERDLYARAYKAAWLALYEALTIGDLTPYEERVPNPSQ